MSNKCLNYVWEFSKTKGSARVLMLAIADIANDDGTAYPGKLKLSKKCNVTDRQVTRLIQECERAGELIVVQGGIQQKGQRNVSNHYVIRGVSDWKPPKARKPKIKKIRAFPVVLTPVSPLPSPDTSVTPPMTPVTPQGVTLESHNPLVEPLLNPQSLTPDGGWQIKDIVQFVEQRGKTTYSTLVATFGREAQLEIQKLVRDGKLKDDFDGYSIPTENDEQPSPVDDYLATQVEPPNEYDLLLERVEHHFAVSGLYSKDMTAMLCGTSDTGEWKANNLKTPITADEFDDWVDYYKTKQRPGASLPQNPEKLAGYVNGWIKLGKPKRLFHSSTRVATPLAPPPALNDTDRAALSEQIRAMKEGIAANGQ